MLTDKQNKILNVPNLRFKEFQGEWEKVIVSDLLQFYSTNSLSWEQLDYETGDIYNLHYGLIHVGLPSLVDLNSDKLPLIKEGNEPKNYTLCKKGDIVFADASEDTDEVAKAIEFINVGEGNIVAGLHTIHGRDIFGKTVPGFKAYAFAAPSFHHQIRRIAQGTKIFSISSKNFSECYIGIPQKSEQTKIANLLTLIDARITTQSRLIEDLKALRDGIRERMICTCKHDEPCLRSKNYTEKWNTFKLADFTERVMRKNTNNESSNVLTIAAQYGLVSQEDFFSKTVASSDVSGYYLLQKGEFAYNKSYSKDYSWGAVKRLDAFNEGILSTLYICFSVNTNICDSDYLVHYFESTKWYEEVKNIAGEGARNHGLLNVSVSDFFNTKHKLPNLEEQKHIAITLNCLMNKMKNEERYLHKLNKQKEYLLRNMFI